MRKTDTSKYTVLLAVGLVIFVILAVVFYVESLRKRADIEVLNTEKETLITENNAKSQKLLEASTTIAALTSELNLTEEELDELEDDFRKEKRKNDDFEEQIDKIAGTVGDLDKLSKTDEELLQKYSKVYFLNENYIPSKIKKINDRYVPDGKDDQYFHGNALSFLENMIDDADDDGITLQVVSAYRSFDEQSDLKGQFTQIYGSGANTFSADQGYSEHQLGTTLDLTDLTTNGTYTSFADTKAYSWLLKNAHKFGFTLSYPKDNNFYVFEPWHWRFVGEDLARDLRKDNASFYDWEQRAIDEYLIKIFD